MDEIRNVAEFLVKNGVIRAVPALSDQRQLEFFRRQEKMPRSYPRYLAKETAGRALMEFLFEKYPDPDVSEGLAKNLALPGDLQIRVLKRALGEAGDDEDSDWNDVAESLLGNENVCDETLRFAAKHLVESDLANAELMEALLDCDRLPPDVLTSIDKAMKSEFREEWSLTVLGQENAGKALVEKAFRRYYDDEEEILGYLKKIRSLEPKEWWKKLAGSPFEELWETASLNTATDSETLVALARDKSKNSYAIFNPAIPERQLAELLAEIVADDQNDDFSILHNPNFSIQTLRDIANNGKKYGLRSKAWEVLAVRTARAGSGCGVK